tara:strand:- start:8661 stop:9773 length:1113 start_codon:yes stop_codon:yes gene_type:complete
MLNEKNILFIVTGIKIGGLETYLLRFLKSKKNKINPIILVQNLDKDELFYEDFIKMGVKIVYLPIRFSPLSFSQFFSLLKREKINCVCDFRGDFSGISLLYSSLANTKNRIVFYRESEFQFKPTFLKNLYIRFLHFLTLKFSTKILSNSNQAFHSFYKKNELNKKYHKVIRNGVFKKHNEKVCFHEDIRKKYSIPKNSFVIGHIGRFTPAKNHKLLIQIAKDLCKNQDDIYLLLCGRKISESIIDDLTESSIREKVITPGLCTNIYSYLQAMDVFVFPSLNEGQPNALIEAMITGLPIVASNIPSIKETVSEEMNQVLFSPTDKEAFVKEIRKIKNGQISYNVNDVKIWSRNAYSQKDRFLEFYNELLHQ